MKRGTIILWTLTLCAFAFLFAPRHVSAADQVVTNCANDTELRNDLAAMQSSGGGILTFSCGTATIVLTGGTLPTITTATYIDGGNKITISGNNAARIFYVVGGGALNLYNLTLTKGYASYGGAIYSIGTLDINSSKFLQNQATGSGGAILNGGTLHIVGSEFAYNKAASGGAIHLYYSNSGSTISASNLHHNETTGTSAGTGLGGAIYLEVSPLTILNSTLNDNKARIGGGIYVGYTSSVALDASMVNYNQAIEISGTGGEGGGLYTESAATLTNSTLAGNSATNTGGAIDNYLNGNFDLTNVTISNNSAEFGGGINNTKGNGTLTNVTMIGNSASFWGGGINNGTYMGDRITLKNTIVANSPSGGNCYDTNAKSIDSAGFNLSSDNTCTEFFDQGGDLNNTDPMVGDLALNGGPTTTRMLLPGSPAIDAGTGSGAPSQDQRGIPRPQGTAHDIGAVEVCGKPDAPGLLKPADGKKAKGPNVALDWNDTLCATKYIVTVRLGSQTGTKVFTKKNLTTSTTTTTALTKGQIYFWQVTAVNSAGKTKSEWWSFKVK